MLELTWRAVLFVDGEIDASNAAMLENVLAWREGDAVHIDMHDCTFMGSDALRALVKLCARDVAVHIWRPSHQVRRVLELAAVDQFVTIH